MTGLGTDPTAGPPADRHRGKGRLAAAGMQALHIVLLRFVLYRLCMEYGVDSVSTPYLRS